MAKGIYNPFRDEQKKELQNPLDKLKICSGSTLKIIAVVTMLIDHVGAAILERQMTALGFEEATEAVETYNRFIDTYFNLYMADLIMRSIGRISFPIFCFLLVEGFLHTKDIKAYIMRMFAFCMIAEIPFDLAFYGELFHWEYQNVFFTLTIGLCVLYGIKSTWSLEKIATPVKIILQVLYAACGAALATFLRTDYSWMGVLAIILLYVLRNRKPVQILGGGALFMIESPFASLGFLPIAMYNGKRGFKLKYFFYVFYPAHLLILYGIAKLMKLC